MSNETKTLVNKEYLERRRGNTFIIDGLPYKLSDVRLKAGFDEPKAYLGFTTVIDPCLGPNEFKFCVNDGAKPCEPYSTFRRL